MKNRHLRARLPEEEYRALKIAADRDSLTVSEYVRCVIARDQQVLDQKQLLTEIDKKLATVSRLPEPTSIRVDDEPWFAELLLMTRELVADRNPQALSRINHQLNLTYPNRRKL